MQKRRLSLLVLLSALMVLLLAFTGAASAAVSSEVGGRPLYASMTGGQEAPNAGDPDAFGHAYFTLNQGQGLICYTLHVENIDAATAAHIHIAPPGVAGPVVVPLTRPDASGTSEGCASVDPALIKEIRKNPGAYYVNVHNAMYPGGAVRGQLTAHME